ncbi:unnamed protein product, partial [Coregonus sp. 'balchen']
MSDLLQRAKTMGHPHQHHHQHQHPGAVANSNMGPTIGHMMEMMSPRQRHAHLQQHHQHLQQAPPISYQQHCHAPPHHLGNSHSQGHQSGNVPHHQVHQSPPSHLQASHTHQTSPHLPLPSIAVQLSPATQQMQSSQQTHSLHAGQATGGRRRRSVDQDPDERRQKVPSRGGRLLWKLVKSVDTAAVVAMEPRNGRRVEYIFRLILRPSQAPPITSRRTALTASVAMVTRWRSEAAVTRPVVAMEIQIVKAAVEGEDVTGEALEGRDVTDEVSPEAEDKHILWDPRGGHLGYRAQPPVCAEEVLRVLAITALGTEAAG